MGNRFSYRSERTSGVEELDPNMTQTYRFPPKSGSYFASHFIMAGEKFDNMNPERFLFGENADLNYLTNKPRSFPYPSPGANEPSHSVRCLVHLRKESLKLVKVVDNEDPGYTVEFTFDADVSCAVRIFMMASGDITSGTAKYTTRTPELTSEPVMFSKGANQVYSNPKFVIRPDPFQPSELSYIPGSGLEIPLVIQLTVEDVDFVGQSESTLAGIEKLSDGGHSIKFMKQKLMIDGFSIIAQEIYGIENKSNADAMFDDDDELSNDANTECLICMENLRDTLLLPCRHLCLCKTCAEAIRTKESRCPICRGNFHALLQIVGVRTKSGSSGDTEKTYEEFPIIEALVGNTDIKPKCNMSAKSLKPRRVSSSRSVRSSGRSRSGRISRVKDSATSLRSSAKKVETDPSIHGEETAIVEPSAPLLTPTPKYRVDVEATKAEVSTTAEICNEDADQNINKLHPVMRGATDVDEEEKPNEHMDPSLPGTPMGSDRSVESLGHSVMGSTTMLIGASSGSLNPTHTHLTTPALVESKPAEPTDDENM